MLNELLVALHQTKPIFWCCDDDKTRKIVADEIPEPTPEDIEAYKRKGLGLYFLVNEAGDVPNEKNHFRYNENIVRPLACFADFDHGSFDEQIHKIMGSPLEPSAWVKSGHGYHVYWFLDGATKEDLPRWVEVQKAIAHHFKSDASVIDPARIMRLPGSWHCKDPEKKLVTLEKCDPTLRYSMEDLVTEFPPVVDLTGASDVAKVMNTTTEEGGRFAASQKVIGAILNRFKPSEWETLGWPMVKSWNATDCKPPKSEHILRQVFDGILKLEAKKRAAEEKHVVTFADGDMRPQVMEDGENIIVQIPVEEGVAKFSFQNIEQTKSDTLNVLLSVEHLILGSHPRPFTQRINLLSGSSMEALSRMLGKSFGKTLPWEMMLNTAQSALLRFLSNRDLSMDLSEVPDEEAPVLFAPFLVKDGANLLFGDGGTGKTYFCLRLALSLATGKEFLGYTPQEATGTLFVDYEDNEKTASFRLSRLCADPALNLDPKVAKKFVRYLNPQGAPLYTIIPALKKIIQEHNIGLILVDSVASACGAEPEKAEAAAQYYNALKSLNITSLSIAHVTKTEGAKQDKAFGSVFWHNLARNTWNIQGEEDPEEEKISLSAVMGEKSRQLGMFHRKYNSGPKSPPINMRITYGVNNVRFEEGKPDYWNKDKKLETRIVTALKLNGGRTKNELEEDLLDVSPKTLKNMLSIMKQKGTIVKDADRGGKYRVGTTFGTTKPVDNISPEVSPE
jgi:AAA domain-containing protein